MSTAKTCPFPFFLRVFRAPEASASKTLIRSCYFFARFRLTGGDPFSHPQFLCSCGRVLGMARKLRSNIPVRLIIPLRRGSGFLSIRCVLLQPLIRVKDCSHISYICGFSPTPCLLYLRPSAASVVKNPCLSRFLPVSNLRSLRVKSGGGDEMVFWGPTPGGSTGGTSISGICSAADTSRRHGWEWDGLFENCPG